MSLFLLGRRPPFAFNTMSSGPRHTPVCADFGTCLHNAAIFFRYAWPYCAAVRRRRRSLDFRMLADRGLPAVSSHVPVVFGKATREQMAALIVTYKVERASGGRIQRRPDRCLTGRTDRTARQSGAGVGIVRRIDLQLISCQRIR